LEASLKIAKNDPNANIDLSEWYLWYKGTPGENPDPGGWYEHYASDFLKEEGTVEETITPYSGAKLFPTFSEPPANTPNFKIKKWDWQTGDESVKAALAKGPLVGGIPVYSDFPMYTKGIYRHVWGELVGWHAIILVGYDDDQKCWVCKNSWSASWGENGYFRIAYGQEFYPYFFAYTTEESEVLNSPTVITVQPGENSIDSASTTVIMVTFDKPIVAPAKNPIKIQISTGLGSNSYELTGNFSVSSDNRTIFCSGPFFNGITSATVYVNFPTATITVTIDGVFAGLDGTSGSVNKIWSYFSKRSNFGISGKVALDTTKEALDNVPVEIKRGGISLGGTQTKGGSFRFEGLVAGNYEIALATDSTIYHPEKFGIHFNEDGSGVGDVIYIEMVKKTIDLGGGVQMALAKIPSGTFTMGCPVDEPGRWADDWLPHQVTLTKGFLMGIHEVTQAQYLKITGSNPSFFIPTQTEFSSGYPDTSQNPVETVSWLDCIRYCNALSANQGLAACYTDQGGSPKIDDGDTVTCNWTTNGYRLPTEAEWEYACRAGSTGMYYWGMTYDQAQMKQYCWYDMNTWVGSWTDPHAAKGGTQPVGTRLPNAWGLYDMSGNVWEWCNDWWEWQSARGPQTDPRGPLSGLQAKEACIRRGGGWSFFWDGCRTAGRFRGEPTFREQYLGFRVVRTTQ